MSNTAQPSTITLVANSTILLLQELGCKVRVQLPDGMEIGDQIHGAVEGQELPTKIKRRPGKKKEDLDLYTSILNEISDVGKPFAYETKGLPESDVYRIRHGVLNLSKKLWAGYYAKSQINKGVSIVFTKCETRDATAKKQEA